MSEKTHNKPVPRRSEATIRIVFEGTRVHLYLEGSYGPALDYGNRMMEMHPLWVEAKNRNGGAA